MDPAKKKIFAYGANFEAIFAKNLKVRQPARPEAKG
jgi:hypothetical protein